ncbi:MAG: N-acetylmuramic acid 6-phosphate etherase [Trueperaceae bacterium]|nr:N-acetylmuramic acid 6-phosphate etherase [Trueperaceae bacterium]
MSKTHSRPITERFATESVDNTYAGLDSWPARDIVAAVTAANAKAIAAVAAAEPELAAAAEGIEGRLARGGRLIYVGAGTSGRIGVQDAAELPPTFGYDDAVVLLAGGSLAQTTAKEGAEDDVEAALVDIAATGVTADDAVVGLAASGGTPYTIAALKRAREIGAFTVGIANNPGSPLLNTGDVGVLLDTGPEVLAGSTRLAAGTAQKAAINAVSTAVLVRLGGAYDNLMIGMRPVNEKLRHRAAAIVAQAAGLTTEQAAATLASAGHDMRVAIVMAKSGASAEASRELLEHSGGHVRRALELAAGR